VSILARYLASQVLSTTGFVLVALLILFTFST
jgi:lipopolysaccharide export LptBFGC system permease protein LptF